MAVVKSHDLYLGLPTFSLKEKRLQFDYIRERICKRTNGWSSKFFSMEGREVLIKSVLQAIPSYAMSCFKLPISLCRRVEQVCANFWWKGLDANRVLHRTKWQNLCKPKWTGGLGFRNLINFNKALLAKQVWRIIQFPSSLMARVLKGKYFKNKDIMDAEAGSHPSYVWRSLMWGKELLSNLCWRVGNGISIRAHQDPWIPNLSGNTSTSHTDLNFNCTVDRYLIGDGLWNETLVRNTFNVFEAEAILNIPLNRRGCEDVRFWIGSKDGKYSVKLGYQLDIINSITHPSQSSPPDLCWWKMLWKLRIPPKRSPQELLWKQPPTNQFSLNVDAGFDEGSQKCSVGAVIRDSNGLVRGALATVVRHPGSVLRGELLAIRIGMEQCLKMGIHNVHVFSDSPQAIDAISNTGDLGLNGVITKDIQVMLQSDKFLSIQHTRRDANKVAHLIARKAFSLSSSTEWCTLDYPAWLCNIANQDITH